MEQYVQHGECSVGNSKTKLIEYISDKQTWILEKMV